MCWCWMGGGRLADEDAEHSDTFFGEGCVGTGGWSAAAGRLAILDSGVGLFGVAGCGRNWIWVWCAIRGLVGTSRDDPFILVCGGDWNCCGNLPWRKHVGKIRTEFALFHDYLFPRSIGCDDGRRTWHRILFSV